MSSLSAIKLLSCHKSNHTWTQWGKSGRVCVRARAYVLVLPHTFFAASMPHLRVDASRMRQTIVALCLSSAVSFLQSRRFLLRLAELQPPGSALLGVADGLHFI